MYSCFYPSAIYSPLYRYPYPPVDIKIFSKSVQSFRLLMDQGSILLDRLADASFVSKMMNAAQQGKQTQVNSLIQSIGLKVPVTTHYTPSGVVFTLSTAANQNTALSCCTLTFSLKWGS